MPTLGTRSDVILGAAQSIAFQRRQREVRRFRRATPRFSEAEAQFQSTRRATDPSLAAESNALAKFLVFGESLIGGRIFGREVVTPQQHLLDQRAIFDALLSQGLLPVQNPGSRTATEAVTGIKQQVSFPFIDAPPLESGEQPGGRQPTGFSAIPDSFNLGLTPLTLGNVKKDVSGNILQPSTAFGGGSAAHFFDTGFKDLSEVDQLGVINMFREINVVKKMLAPLHLPSGTTVDEATQIAELTFSRVRANGPSTAPSEIFFSFNKNVQATKLGGPSIGADIQLMKNNIFIGGKAFNLGGDLGALTPGRSQAELQAFLAAERSTFLEARKRNQAAVFSFADSSRLPQLLIPLGSPGLQAVGQDTAIATLPAAFREFGLFEPNRLKGFFASGGVAAP